MAEVYSTNVHVLKVSDRELSIIIRGLGSLINPELVKIRAEEKKEVADLNVQLCHSSIGSLKHSTKTMEKRLEKAKEFQTSIPDEPSYEMSETSSKDGANLG